MHGLLLFTTTSRCVYWQYWNAYSPPPKCLLTRLKHTDTTHTHTLQNTLHIHTHSHITHTHTHTHFSLWLHDPPSGKFSVWKNLPRLFFLTNCRHSAFYLDLPLSPPPLLPGRHYFTTCSFKILSPPLSCFHRDACKGLHHRDLSRRGLAAGMRLFRHAYSPPTPWTFSKVADLNLRRLKLTTLGYDLQSFLPAPSPSLSPLSSRLYPFKWSL